MHKQFNLKAFIVLCVGGDGACFEILWRISQDLQALHSTIYVQNKNLTSMLPKILPTINEKLDEIH